MAIGSIYAIDVMRKLIGVGSLSLDDDDPCDQFKNDGDGAQDDDDSGVSSFPFVIGAQDFESFEHVDDAQNDHTVSDRVMVYIPVDSVFVILVWPQEQSENLK